MKLSVIGCGYLGAVHAAAWPISATRSSVSTSTPADRASRAGRAPFFEPGLPELLAPRCLGPVELLDRHGGCRGRHRALRRRRHPAAQDGHAADLTYVDAAIDGLLPYLAPGDMVVGKSTVPVGTAAVSRIASRHGTGAMLAWNPEFLREGFAVKDTMSPTASSTACEDDRDGTVLDEVYARRSRRGRR